MVVGLFKDAKGSDLDLDMQLDQVLSDLYVPDFLNFEEDVGDDLGGSETLLA